MHIFFSGIGGAGIGPLAELAQQAGYDVSGSDRETSLHLDELKRRGITDISIGQTGENIARVHSVNPIDWLVISSAVAIEQPDSEELKFAREMGIRLTKRDELINEIVSDKKLSMIAIAGTHGKTTTTAMIVWLCRELGLTTSHLLPAETAFGPMGKYEPDSSFFIIEADEFDRNFLSFNPWLSVISGVSWDHHEIYPSRESYQQAFKDFIGQSEQSLIWQDDAAYLGILPEENPGIALLDPANPKINDVKLKGIYNRLDAWLAVMTVMRIDDRPLDKLIEVVNRFPGLSRRMEMITPNLYSDYAHTPEKIRGAMSVAKEMAAESGQNIVVVYEPLTDRRQHYIINEYGNVFSGASQVYWLPSYLAREDPNQRILAPAELIARLSDPTIAQPAEKDEGLKRMIDAQLKKGAMVICLAGGGPDSLDDWLRKNYT